MADITDLIARLREWGIPTAVRAADALTAQAATIAEQARELEALRADAAVRQAQVDSLRDALRKVLYTRNKEAKASMSYRVARENFGDSNYERKAHERAMFAASDAEREARTLLLTLRDIPDAALQASEPTVSDKCRKCGGRMVKGTYLAQTMTGIPDFPGDRHAVTVSPGGPGWLAECLKCDVCGHSVTGGKAGTP